MLDFWNSELYGNFGGDVLGKLGVGSLGEFSTASKFHTGGRVFGNGGEVPAYLQGGEYVINRRSSQNIGYDNLNRMNSTGSAVDYKRMEMLLEQILRATEKGENITINADFGSGIRQRFAVIAEKAQRSNRSVIAVSDL